MLRWPAKPVTQLKRRYSTGLSRLEPRALVFFTAGDVAAAGGGRSVLLTLHVLGNPVSGEFDATGVLEGLEIATNTIAVGCDRAALLIKLQVAVDGVTGDKGASALLDLNAAAYDRRTHDYIRGAFGLDVADDFYAGGAQDGVGAHFDRTFGLGAIERAGGAVGHKDVVLRHGANGATAPVFFSERHLTGWRHKRRGQDHCEYHPNKLIHVLPFLHSRSSGGVNTGEVDEMHSSERRGLASCDHVS